MGLLVASWSMDVLRVLLPDSLPRAADVRVDSGVIAFALALSNDRTSYNTGFCGRCLITVE